MPHPKLMVMVSFCSKMNFLPTKIKNKAVFIEDVLEINDWSCCILSGPPCIVLEWQSSLVEFVAQKLTEYYIKNIW